MSRGQRLLFVLVFLWAALLRFSGLAWDGWHHQHPDERFLVMVAGALALPSSPAVALDPARTSANPNNRGFSFFVYGALPPVVERAVAVPLGMADYVGLLKVGRVLAVLVDLLGLALVAALAGRLGGGKAALLTGALYASCPLLIQQSRFGTCDVWGSTAVLLVAWLVAGREPTLRRVVLAGVAVGLATACKPNLVLAGLIPATAVLIGVWRSVGRVTERLGRLALAWLLLGISALLALKLADPGAFAATASVLPNPRRLASLRELAGFFSGQGQFPPNLQWADRRPLLDPLANLLIWGTGPLLGAAVALGLTRTARRVALRDLTWLPVLAWLVPAATLQLSHFVCSVRHLETFLPVGIIAAGLWLVRRRPAFVAATLATTAVWGLLWASLAWQPYTRVEASRWLRDHLRPDAVVTSEHWDDALPLGGEGSPWMRVVELPVFEADTASKRERLLQVLDQADAVVLSSQRGVGSICRVPDAYPLTAEYYHLLFSGALGFRLQATFVRRLGVGTLSLGDLAAEESLSVYDHPPVWIFVKTPAYSPVVARALLERVALPFRNDWQTFQLECRGTPPYLEPTRAGGTLPGSRGLGLLGQALAVIRWLAALEVVGLLGGAMLRRVAPGLPDGGWGAGRWLGLAACGVAWMWLGWIAVPGWNSWLPTLVLLLALPWAVPAYLQAWRERPFRIAAAVFWVTFALFLALRAANPEIYWGEKPMDAALLTGAWRATSLPPCDPWVAGTPLGYYFFGTLPYALLGRATGVGLGLGFNLAAATVPALTAGGALAVGWLLAGRLGGGLLAALLAQFTGTAGVLFHKGLLARPDFDLFWATSRVTSGGINEYPVWTALFADLHAHFFGFPGFLAGVLVASALALGAARWRPSAVLLGGVLAVEGMTNTWELPTLALLGAAAALVTVRGGTWWPRLLALARWGARLAWWGLVFSLPFWIAVRTAAGGFSFNRPIRVEPIALVELFGVVGTLLLAALAALLTSRASGRLVRWGLILVGVGLSLVLLPSFATVADAMNTVFKFHLQAQLLLAVAAGGLLGATLPALARVPRVALTAVVTGALLIGLVTSVSDARGALAIRRVPGPRPTLDGEAYLRTWAPDQAAVLATLAELPYGGVVAEPLGTPYSDTLRVPMFCGLSVVAGWEYHLWQRRHSRGDIARAQADQSTLLEGGVGDAMAKALALRYGVNIACTWTGDPPAVAWALHMRELARSGPAAAFVAAGKGTAR